MTSTTILLIGILVVLAVAGWLLGHARWLGRSRQAGNDDIDREVLEEAEEEVRGLDAFTTPDEADDELPDWGPGTAKH